MKLFNRKKKLYLSYIETGFAAVLFLLIAIPFANKAMAKDVTYTPDERYHVVLNGRNMGYVSDEEQAQEALVNARKQLNSENSGLALVKADLQVSKEASSGSIVTEESLSDSMYDMLKQSVVDTDSSVTAYTVRIDDFTVTLGSKEEVAQLFEKVKDNYSGDNTFTVELKEADNGIYTSLKTDFVSADVTIKEASRVLASANGKKGDSDSTENVVYKDGVLSIGIKENVEIIETKALSDNIVSVDEAYELITKEHAEKGTYKVKAGDCISSIAKSCGLTMKELFSLNYGLNENSAIYPGDELIVTVPASEISVVTVEEASYDEQYDAEIQYVDNASIYEGTENVIQEGKKGTRSVVALVTSVNGKESKREIIKETVSKEAVPKIVERGTMVRPSYIKPVNSSYISSPFGWRAWSNSYHTGVDWYVPTGTAVRAAASGVVTSAGWNGNYGYCIDITHSNGSLTRYAHLNSIGVAYGQSVTQGQVIGYSGSTGFSTGPHLHFEIRIGGNPVNPIDYVGY